MFIHTKRSGLMACGGLVLYELAWMNSYQNGRVSQMLHCSADGTEALAFGVVSKKVRIMLNTIQKLHLTVNCI